MLELILAFSLFVALHSIPALPRIRQRLIAALGHRVYVTVYSLISVGALAWLFEAALNTDYIEIWEPAPWQAWVTLVAAPLGLFLVLAGLLSNNPFSISFRSGHGRTGAMVAITRHPVLWGFLLWALGHVVPNGDLRSVILFGGFAAFSVGGLFMLERRARRKFAANWNEASRASSVLPFRAILQRRSTASLDLPMIVAAISTAAFAAWLLLANGHALLFAADPLALALP